MESRCNVGQEDRENKIIGTQQSRTCLQYTQKHIRLQKDGVQGDIQEPCPS